MGRFRSIFSCIAKLFLLQTNTQLAKRSGIISGGAGSDDYKCIQANLGLNMIEQFLLCGGCVDVWFIYRIKRIFFENKL